jgi:hypothetical protein
VNELPTHWDRWGCGSERCDSTTFPNRECRRAEAVRPGAPHRSAILDAPERRAALGRGQRRLFARSYTAKDTILLVGIMGARGKLAGQSEPASPRRDVLKTALAAVGVLAYSWWAAAQPPFTFRAYLAITLPAIAAAVFAVRRLSIRPTVRDLLAVRRTPDESSESSWCPPAVRGVVAWAILIALLAAWQLYNYASLPRAAHPTVSSVLESALSSDVIRAVLFLLWLWFGREILRR